MYTPRLTKIDNSIIPIMYKEWWRLITIYQDTMYWEKDIKREIKQKIIPESNLFDKWYSLYPKKKAKQDALKAWSKLSDEEMEIALENLPKYKEYWRKEWTTLDYIPLPASWLNGKRWQDNLSTQETSPPIKPPEEEESEEEKEAMLFKRFMTKWITENKEEYEQFKKQAEQSLTPEQRIWITAKYLIDTKTRWFIYDIFKKWV